MLEKPKAREYKKIAKEKKPKVATIKIAQCDLFAFFACIISFSLSACLLLFAYEFLFNVWAGSRDICKRDSQWLFMPWPDYAYCSLVLDFPTMLCDIAALLLFLIGFFSVAINSCKCLGVWAFRESIFLKNRR